MCSFSYLYYGYVNIEQYVVIDLNNVPCIFLPLLCRRLSLRVFLFTLIVLKCIFWHQSVRPSVYGTITIIFFIDFGQIIDISSSFDIETLTLSLVLGRMAKFLNTFFFAFPDYFRFDVPSCWGDIAWVLRRAPPAQKNPPANSGSLAVHADGDFSRRSRRRGQRPCRPPERWGRARTREGKGIPKSSRPRTSGDHWPSRQL